MCVILSFFFFYPILYKGLFSDYDSMMVKKMSFTIINFRFPIVTVTTQTSVEVSTITEGRHSFRGEEEGRRDEDTPDFIR